MKLDVTQEEAQLIINALAAQPYNQVAGLIPKILTQARQEQVSGGTDQDATPTPPA